MKYRILTIVLIFLLSTYVAQAYVHEADGSNPLDRKIELPGGLPSLLEWFGHIEREGKIIISYDPAQMDLAKRTGISGQEKKSGHKRKRKKVMTVRDILKILLKEYRYETAVTAHDRIALRIIGKRGIHDGDDLRKEEEYEEKILDEITINPSSGKNELDRKSASSSMSVSSSDPMYQLNFMPGITGFPVSGNFHVNGGGNDENLILVDGIPVYHPGHINSLRSAFNGDAIRRITFHKDYFPTKYEGRLSSITEIELKEGDRKEDTSILSIDMPSASVNLDGPLIMDRLTYSVGARRSWLDFFDELLSESERLNHSFYDFNAKITYHITKKTKANAFVYSSENRYILPVENNVRKEVLRWKNRIYSLQLKSRLSDKLSVNGYASLTDYSNSAYARELDLEADGYLKSGIRHLNLGAEFTFMQDNSFNAGWGVKISRELYNLAVFGKENGNRTEPVTQISLFYDNTIRITGSLRSEIGINLVSYNPDNHRKYISLQPRLTLKWKLTDSDLLFINFSRMEQFYHYLKFEVLNLPTDFMMPSIDNYRPSSSWFGVSGWKHFFKAGTLETSIYYKSRGNIMALRPEEYPSDNGWEKYIMTGNGKCFGFSAHLNLKYRKLSTQISYTFSRSLESFGNDGYPDNLPSLQDIPHLFTCAARLRLTQHSSLFAGGIVKSGKVIDVNDIYYQMSAEDFRRKREAFNYRLDAGYSFEKELKKCTISMKAGLFNIIGNPPDEEILDFYSVTIQRNCLPYGSFSLSF